MPHVVLLGDSVFDNGKYVRPDPDDVAAQLRELLPASWQVTRRAVDGATTDAVTEQVVEIPTSATHLVLSVGGNDLLGCAGELLRHPVRESSQAFLLLAKVMDVFEVRYRDVVQRCRTVGLPLLICTIYNGNFADAEFQIMARVAVAAFNDVILRVAREAGVATLDLRLICRDPEDFANSIEPSSIGGLKIAQAIRDQLHWVTIL